MGIVVIDYGIGNVKSIVHSFSKSGASPVLTSDKNEILNADGLVLPGVGAFAHGMDRLYAFDLVDCIRLYAKSGKPLLGICLGMQMLLDTSEEFGETKGLGLVSGKVTKLPPVTFEHAKLPHINWSEISRKNIGWENTILDKVPNGSDMYFVHSFVAEPSDENTILAVSQYYEQPFCAAIKKENIYGTQFHPEKSGELGRRIVENFIKISEVQI